jgi:hypothetical protein
MAIRQALRGFATRHPFLSSRLQLAAASALYQNGLDPQTRTRIHQVRTQDVKSIHVLNVLTSRCGLRHVPHIGQA